MALSLVCQDCNTQLRSVKDAQEHADATGHSNFAESEAAVLQIVCKECGKACKSEVERDLHTKRTGHAEFQDKTGQAAAINTEAQMAEARAELHDGAPAPADADAAAAAEGAPEELVPAEVNEAVVACLVEMGFGRSRAVRAVYNSGGDSVDAAVAWVADHDGDADLDEELLVPRATARAKLTPDEARAQAAELLRKAKARREAEEREAGRAREAQRVRAGKEMAAAARAEEDARLRRIVEERRREKEEEERAREKIKRKLGARGRRAQKFDGAPCSDRVRRAAAPPRHHHPPTSSHPHPTPIPSPLFADQDRRERRLRLGLPEELTEAEREEEARVAREKAEKEASRRLPVKPVALSEKMRLLLVDLKKAHPGQEEGVKTCFATLARFVANVAAAPADPKFRRIKLTNPAVAQRVGAFTGAVQFLELAGFAREQGGEGLEMAGEPDRMVLEAAGENLSSALNNPFFGML
jgi:hypothetical protein